MNFDPRTDSLTDLFNRTCLAEILAREAARADRYQHALTMLLLDVDHLKEVNEIHGHVVADGLLKSLALLLQSTVRRVEIVFRYGGDAFCILLPVTNLNGGWCLRQRLRNNISASDL